MDEALKLHFVVDGDDFTSAGEASAEVKKRLRLLGYSPETIRRVSIAMYEGEINMVIHAGGGVADVFIHKDKMNKERTSNKHTTTKENLSNKNQKLRRNLLYLTN